MPSLFASNDNRAPAVLNDRFLQQIFISNRNNGISPSSGGIFGIFSAVIHWCYTTFSSFIQTLLSVFSGQERSKWDLVELAKSVLTCFSLLSLLVVTDPLGDVLNFIRDYNIKFPVHPVFYQGTYAQVLNDAKRELKFLLIYLHSATISKHIQSGQERVTETISFCRNTLSNPEVVDYVNKNMLFWACDISSPEGYRVSHSINARTYPLLVIIGLRDNKMTIMGRSEGDCTPQEFLGRLQRVVNDNERYINAARHERLERSLTQTLRAQQDVAYEESLRADREKEKKRQREREEQQQIEKEIQENVEAGERRAKLKEEVRIEIMQQIPSEPAETEADTLNIIFKLPNGMRINRRFLKSDSLIVSCLKFSFLLKNNFSLSRTFKISCSVIRMHPMLSK